MKTIQSYRIDSNLVDQINNRSIKTGQSKTRIIEEAVRYYFKTLNRLND